MKVEESLKNGIRKLNENNIEDASLKSRILLSNLLNKRKEELILYYADDIDEKINKDFMGKIERLCNSEPIQYIINKQEFMGLEFYVDENVLIPQPDTEILVEEAIKLCGKSVKILDLCTGSGAIAISLAKKLNQYNEIYASDISKFALEVAKKNCRKNGVNINFIESDMFENISNLEFDIIVSNPPYIETRVIESLPNEVKKEPHIALDGGDDGLRFYRKIAENAKEYLKDNGYLLLEIGYNQKESVEELLKKSNYRNIHTKKDFGGNNRVVIAQK